MNIYKSELREGLNYYEFCNNTTCSKIPEAGEFSLRFLLTFGSLFRSTAQLRDTFSQTHQLDPCQIDVMPVHVQVKLNTGEGIAILYIQIVNL